MKVYIEFYRGFLKWVADNVSDDKIANDPWFHEFVRACNEVMKEERGV